MTWNLNSLAKENFQRASIIEAHNSIFKYDLISICKTSLNDSVELPEPLLNEYSFVSANNPANTRHGGVGLFYKNTLDLSLMTELQKILRGLNMKIFYILKGQVESLYG